MLKLSILLLLLIPTAVSAQEKIVIPLRLNLDVQQSSGYVIASRSDDAQIAYTTPTGDGLGHAPGKEFKTDVSVIAINVDEASRLPNAREIIKTYGLTWPHVMNGRGEADPLWKMFGGMEENRLAIPLYVIVDAEGTLRYAADGGEDLSELRRLIRSLLK